MDENNCYLSEPAVYDIDAPYSDRVVSGYIALPYDVRQLPPSLLLNDRSKIDSFSVAIVKTRWPDALQDPEQHPATIFTSYIQRESFPKYSARDILHPSREVTNGIEHKIVIVGGAWHNYAYNRGEYIDSYVTPVGRIPGAFIHANYVEAILDGRMYYVHNEVAEAVEIALSVPIAIALALDMSVLLTLGIVLASMVIMVVMSYVLLQNFGIFCEFVIPVFLLSCHFVAGKVLEWRRKALAAKGNI